MFRTSLASTTLGSWPSVITVDPCCGVCSDRDSSVKVSLALCRPYESLDKPAESALRRLSQCARWTYIDAVRGTWLLTVVWMPEELLKYSQTSALHQTRFSAVPREEKRSVGNYTRLFTLHIFAKQIWGNRLCLKTFTQQLPQVQNPKQVLSGTAKTEDDRCKSAPTSPCEQGSWRYDTWKTCSIILKEQIPQMSFFFFFPSSTRCQGAGEHPEGSVIWSPRRGEENEPPLCSLVRGYHQGEQQWGWTGRWGW